MIHCYRLVLIWFLVTLTYLKKNDQMIYNLLVNSFSLVRSFVQTF